MSTHIIYSINLHDRNVLTGFEDSLEAVAWALDGGLGLDAARTLMHDAQQLYGRDSDDYRDWIEEELNAWEEFAYSSHGYLCGADGESGQYLIELED